MSVIYRAFKGLAAGAAAVSAANAAAIDLAAFAGAGGDLSPKPACRCTCPRATEDVAVYSGEILGVEESADDDSATAVGNAEGVEMDWPVLAVRSE